MEKGLVSVLMCTKNRSKIFIEAVNSVLTQTYQNFELIIIDGGSLDRTQEIMEILKNKNSKIRTYFVNTNTYTLALNTALYAAKGEFVTILDDDDIFASNKLEAQVNYLVDNPKVDIVGCSCMFNKEFGVASTLNMMDDKTIKELLKENNMPNIFHPNSVMIRMSAIEKVFGDEVNKFRHEFNGGHAVEMFLYMMLINKAKFANINTTLYLYRLGLCEFSLTKSDKCDIYTENMLDKPLTKRKKYVKDLYLTNKNTNIKHE